jgi:uncharacterized phage protein gp47/JayE
MITIPTLQQLQTSILSDLQAQYGVSISLVGKVFLRALSYVQAAKLKLIYLAIANLQKNIFPDTADSESIGGTLERFGRIKLGRNPFPAVAAVYQLNITGTSGATVPAGTQFKSDDSALSPGVIYQLDYAYTLTSSSGSIQVRCLTLGLDGQLNVNDTLTSVVPLAQVSSSAAVSATITAPLAGETLEAYRTAILNSYRLEAQGGAATDYRLWAQDAQGVAKVYPYATSGATGEVDLYVEATIADSLDGKGTPTTAILDEVEDVVEFNPDTTLALNERGRRPLQVIVNFYPVTIVNVDIEIVGFTGVTVAQQATILAAIEDYIATLRPYVSAADLPADQNDLINSNKIIGVIIGAIPNAVFTSVNVEINGSPVTSYTFIDGNIPYLNGITYS